MKSTSQGDVELAHEVGEEEDGALEDADEQQLLALVVARDLLAQLADPPLEVVGLDEDLADSVRGCGSRGRRGERAGSAPSSACHARPRPEPRRRDRAARRPRARGCRRGGPGRAGRGRPRVLGEAAHDQPRERAREGGERRDRDRVAAGERGVDDARRARRPRRAAARRCGPRSPPPPGGSAAAPRPARRGSGCARSRRDSFEGSSRHSSPRARQYAAVSSRVMPSSGRMTRPSRARHPEQRPPPRRRGEPVEDRLGLVGRRVAGRRCRPPSRSAAAYRTSRAHAWRFPLAGPLRAARPPAAPRAARTARGRTPRPRRPPAAARS